jgi:thiol-disulfide isomerase/thioredoxin
MRLISTGALIIFTLTLSACYSGGPQRDFDGGGGGPSALAGAPALSYELKRIDGRTDSLARHRGSVVLMNLWATWCPPCQAEIPDLERFSREYRSRGVVVLGIDQGESAQAASAYARKRGVTYPILLDEHQQYGRSYAAIGLPTTVVIDRTGHVVHGIDGALSLAQMREAVASALAAK